MTIFQNAAVVGKKKDHVASSPACRIVEAEIAWFVGVGKEEDSLAGGGDDSAEAGDPAEVRTCRQIQTLVTRIV
jgi:hypothetical protein